MMFWENRQLAIFEKLADANPPSGGFFGDFGGFMGVKQRFCYFCSIKGVFSSIYIYCYMYILSYFFIKKWPFKVMYDVYYRAKRDKKDAT